MTPKQNTPSVRRQRFKDMRKRKIERSEKIHRSFETLTQKSNCTYKEEELWEIIQTLRWQVIRLFMHFAKETRLSVEDKVEKLTTLEAEELRHFKTHDEELYDHIVNNLPRGLMPAIENYMDRAAFNSKMYKGEVKNRFNAIKDMHKSLDKAESLVQKEIARLNKKVESIK